MSKRQVPAASSPAPQPLQRRRPRSIHLNIFRVEVERVEALKRSLAGARLDQLNRDEVDGWSTSFWLTSVRPHDVPWLEPFQDLLDDETYYSLNHAGAYVLERDEACFVVSYGTAFHAIYRVADPEFGLSMAKRIGDEHQVKQQALRRFGSKKHKEITSFGPGSGLFLRSGEAVDLVTADIRAEHRATYGKSGRFGCSFHMTAKGGRDAIPGVCDAILGTLDQPEEFELPMIIKLGRYESEGYDELLLTAILDDDADPHFTTEGHEVVGVDFVFSIGESYRLRCPGHGSQPFDVLDIESLRSFITTKGIGPDQIFDITVEITDDTGRKRSRRLKSTLEYVVPGENVTLDGGQWKRFNEEYLDQLDRAVDKITILETEPEFMEITTTETVFNASTAVETAGYENADKDFSKISVKGSSTPVEAYDLKHGNTVYAVKFGSAQTLGYVCEQAMAVVEIIRTNADDADFTAPATYCLWLGLDRTIPAKLSELKSIILKQRLAAWALACGETEMKPAVKLSRRVKPKKFSA